MIIDKHYIGQEPCCELVIFKYFDIIEKLRTIDIWVFIIYLNRVSFDYKEHIPYSSYWPITLVIYVSLDSVIYLFIKGIILISYYCLNA